ncbi:MAG: cytochrome b/b6 domain-containing protein [Caldisericaceae bacterium]|nr:cytochrome b/b6 domain-containing protein [Caldisericaceae bacterium]
MKKLYLYPLWLRIWHWTNATLYIVLILTSISMHYPSPDNPLIPFKTARLIHMYLDFLIGNIFTWNGKHYIPNFKELFQRIYLQTRFYLFGIFKGEPHSFEVDEKRKFNPL